MSRRVVPPCNSVQVYYIYNTQGGDEMDFIRNLQPKDWMIAAVAFFAGAIIF